MSLKSTERVEKNTQELVFSVSAEELDAACNKVYNKQKKNIQVPGFRKGKASRKLVEKLYGEGTFFEDAINEILNGILPAEIEAEKLNVVAQPQAEILAISKEEGAEIKVVCTLYPEVSVKDYKGVAARKDSGEVTDEAINREIDVIRSRNSRIVSVDDRPAQTGDEVNIDFEGKLDGVAFEGGTAQSFPLTLGSGQFIPGFEEQVVGHSIGEEFDITVTFPAEYQMEELAGKETVFSIKLNSISTKETPELDDEFVKDASEFNTVDELREDIRKKLAENAEKNAESKYESDVLGKVLENTDVVIPPVMIHSRVDALMESFETSLTQQGMTLDLYMQYTGMTVDSMRESFEDRAKSEVKLRLALIEIAKQENLDPTQEEISEGIENLAKQTGLTADQVARRLPMGEYLDDLRTTKAVKFVMDNAVVDNTLPEAVEEAEEGEVVDAE